MTRALISTTRPSSWNQACRNEILFMSYAANSRSIVVRDAGYKAAARHRPSIAQTSINNLTSHELRSAKV